MWRGIIHQKWNTKWYCRCSSHTIQCSESSSGAEGMASKQAAGILALHSTLENGINPAETRQDKTAKADYRLLDEHWPICLVEETHHCSWLDEGDRVSRLNKTQCRTPLRCVSEWCLQFTLRFFVHCFPIDTSLNLGSLLSAVSTIKSVYFYGLSLLSALDVPHPVIYHIRDSPMFSSEAERKEAGLRYCLQNLPCLSWERISGVLWYMEEYTALEAVKEYLKHNNGIYKQKSRMVLC